MLKMIVGIWVAWLIVFSFLWGASSSVSLVWFLGAPTFCTIVTVGLIVWSGYEKVKASRK